MITRWSLTLLGQPQALPFPAVSDSHGAHLSPAPLRLSAVPCLSAPTALVGFNGVEARLWGSIFKTSKSDFFTYINSTREI